MAGAAFLMALLNQYSSMDNRNYSEKVRREQNIFNKYEAQRAREWNQQMDSTKYQRTVADMQAAGVNPALAMQGGVTTQASSNATAQAANVPAPQLDLSQVAQLALQEKQLRIQEKLVDAQARKANAEAGLSEIDQQYRASYNEILQSGMKLSNGLTAQNIEQVRANIGKIDQEVELLKKQAKTEEEKAALTLAQRYVQESLKNKTDQEIRNMVALLPFQQALMSAQTDAAKASAAASFAEAAYKHGLLDSGYIDGMVRQFNANASAAEQESLAREIENNLKTGNWFRNDTWTGKLGNTVLQGMTGLGHVLRSFIPISLHM